MDDISIPDYVNSQCSSISTIEDLSNQVKSEIGRDARCSLDCDREEAVTQSQVGITHFWTVGNFSLTGTPDRRPAEVAGRGREVESEQVGEAERAGERGGQRPRGGGAGHGDLRPVHLLHQVLAGHRRLSLLCFPPVSWQGQCSVLPRSK